MNAIFLLARQSDPGHDKGEDSVKSPSWVTFDFSGFSQETVTDNELKIEKCNYQDGKTFRCQHLLVHHNETKENCQWYLSDWNLALFLSWTKFFYSIHKTYKFICPVKGIGWSFFASHYLKYGWLILPQGILITLFTI